MPRAAEATARLDRAQASLFERLPDAKRVLGDDVTSDVIVRLGEDIENRKAQPPADYPAADWSEFRANVERLDADLVEQVLTAKPRALGDIRGLGETLIRVKSDGTLQPVAVYVPASYDGTKAFPLAIALHGRPQTEVELLSPPVLRRLAETTGTIVLAPWGRGNYDFAEPAASEVYELLDAASAAFKVDSRRLYLTGYSMGGFSVFRVGPLHAERWAGVMCISGALVNSQSATVLEHFKNLKVFVVNGGADDSIPAKYGAQTAGFLSHSGIQTGFYQEAKGTHALRTLERVIGLAWRDMLSGKPRGDAPASAASPRSIIEPNPVPAKPGHMTPS